MPEVVPNTTKELVGYLRAKDLTTTPVTINARGGMGSVIFRKKGEPMNMQLWLGFNHPDSPWRTNVQGREGLTVTSLESQGHQVDRHLFAFVATLMPSSKRDREPIAQQILVAPPYNIHGRSRIEFQTAVAIPDAKSELAVRIPTKPWDLGQFNKLPPQLMEQILRDSILATNRVGSDIYPPFAAWLAFATELQYEHVPTVTEVFKKVIDGFRNVTYSSKGQAPTQPT